METMLALLIVFTLLLIALNIDPKRDWWTHKEHQYKEEIGDPISMQTVDVYVDGAYSHTEKRS